jgi:hypothetical protein
MVNNLLLPGWAYDGDIVWEFRMARYYLFQRFILMLLSEKATTHCRTSITELSKLSPQSIAAPMSTLLTGVTLSYAQTAIPGLIPTEPPSLST